MTTTMTATTTTTTTTTTTRDEDKGKGTKTLRDNNYEVEGRMMRMRMVRTNLLFHLQHKTLNTITMNTTRQTRVRDEDGTRN